MTDAFMPYENVRKSFGDHQVRQAEVPVEHFLSLPLPTRRWTVPAYAGFAAPALRRPRQPLEVGFPDRWWGIRADRPVLLQYALTEVQPFGESLPAGPVTVTAARTSVAQLKEDLRVFTELMDDAVPFFFTDAEIDGDLRSDLGEALDAVLPSALTDWCRALAPDFFSWLGR